MRNPFVAMALAAAAVRAMVRSTAIARFQSGQFIDPVRPTSYARKTGMTVASAKRAAIKAKNRARHRAACRG